MDDNQATIRRLRKRRSVRLENGINHNMLTAIRIRMEELARESREDIALIINSTGGDMPCTHRFCDWMKLVMDVPVVGIVEGICRSAAVSILETCPYRYAFPHADFHLHFSANSFEYSLALSEKVIRKKFERTWAEGNHHQAVSEKIIAKRANKTIREVRRAMYEGTVLEKYMCSAEALKFGLIDRIIENPDDLWEKD